MSIAHFSKSSFSFIRISPAQPIPISESKMEKDQGYQRDVRSNAAENLEPMLSISFWSAGCQLSCTGGALSDDNHVRKNLILGHS